MGEEAEEEEREATPNPVPNPVPTPMSVERCVATLESYYTDASTWEPYCKTVGDAGTCPAPMCRMTTSLLATRKTSKRHSFLGNALIQARTDVGPSTNQVAEEL